MAAASIASAFELPRSSVYHLLRVMEEEGFVVWLPEEHLYGLGVAAFELSAELVRTRSRGWGRRRVRSPRGWRRPRSRPGITAACPWPVWR